MSSGENQKGKTDKLSNDIYEAAVLDFLDKELAAAQKPNNQADQSEEVDALVEDLLKQLITETGARPDGSKEASLEGSSLVVSPSEMQGDYFAESNLLSNLNRGLSQTYSEKDLWGGEEAGEDQLSVKVVRTESEIQPAAEPAEALAVATVQENQSLSTLETPAKEKAEVLPFSSYRADITFSHGLIAKKKLPLAAVIFMGVLIIIGSGIYSFVSSRSGSSKAPSAAVGDSVSSKAAEDIYTDRAVTQLETENKVSRTIKAPEKTIKTAASAEGLKSTPVADARQRQNSEKEVPQTVIQLPLSHSPEKTASSLSRTVAEVGGAEAKAEERTMADMSLAASQPVPPRSESSTSGLEKSEAPAAPGNGWVLNGAADKTPIQLAPSAAIRREEITPISKPMPLIPVQQNILVPAVPIQQTSPSYPEIAVRTRTTGSVVLEVQIDEKGRVTKATPVSGPALLHQAAIAAVLQWKYKPATINGVNVPSQSRVTINFNLNK